MKTRKIIRFNLLFFLVLFYIQPIFAQQNSLDLFLSGGINFPNMGDINNIYQQDLETYHDVNYAFDFSSGFTFNLMSNVSLKFGFNYLLHYQNPPVELIKIDGDTTEGNIKYRISGYNPFLGFSFNKSLNSTYRYSLGVNLIYSIARLSDDLEEADTFFDYLKGNGFGFVFESNIRRRISDKFDIGLELGYRILNIKKLKTDSKKYEDQSEDTEFTLNDKTVDLDFSGPLVRLLFVFKM